MVPVERNFEFVSALGVFGADTDLDTLVSIDDALTRGVIEHAAVIVTGSILGVGVGMRIEMNHREFAVLFMMCA